MDQEQQESWAIVELLGHVTMAGRLSEEERFGSKMGRLDIPKPDGGFCTVYFGGSSVYRISPVSEDVARIKASQNQPRPVYAWEIPQAKAESSEGRPRLGFDPPDDDDRDEEFEDDD